MDDENQAYLEVLENEGEDDAYYWANVNLGGQTGDEE